MKLIMACMVCVAKCRRTGVIVKHRLELLYQEV